MPSLLFANNLTAQSAIASSAIVSISSCRNILALAPEG